MAMTVQQIHPVAHLPGRVPQGCGSCFGSSPDPSEGGNQPVIRTRNGFSRPRPALLPCMGTQVRR
jgi:hypothetical protein